MPTHAYGCGVGFFYWRKQMANVDMHYRLYRYMKQQNIDRLGWSFSGGNLHNIYLCEVNGKDVADDYDYDNDFLLDPVIDMIPQTFLKSYAEFDRSGTINIEIVKFVEDKNRLAVAITWTMD